MIAPGWISEDEMKLHLKYMTNDRGKILEGGCAAGRLFSYLIKQKPNWEYHGVNTWSEEIVYLQKDWNKGYFDKDNLSELITEKMFLEYCNFASTYDCKFEKFETNNKFDLISIGQISKNIDWKLTYNKAFTMINKDGFVIGRNINHKKYGDQIKEAIKNYNIIDQVKQTFVLQN